MGTQMASPLHIDGREPQAMALAQYCHQDAHSSPSGNRDEKRATAGGGAQVAHSIYSPGRSSLWTELPESPSHVTEEQQNIPLPSNVGSKLADYTFSSHHHTDVASSESPAITRGENTVATSRVNLPDHHGTEDTVHEAESTALMHKKGARMYFGEISEHQQHFMFLCAGLVIQAIGFQLQSMFDIMSAMMLLCHNAHAVIRGVIHKVRNKFRSEHAELVAHVQSSRQLLRTTYTSVKPFLATGIRTMGWGCLTATYICAMIIALLVTALVLGFFALRYCSNEPLRIRKPLHFDYTKSQPVATVNLWPLSKTHSRSGNTSKAVKMQIQARVLLVLPESYYNRQLGIFQVTAEVLSREGEVVAKASHPCMLHFKGSMARHIKSLFMVMPVLIGLTSAEVQVLALPLVEWVEDRPSSPIGMHINIRLLAHAGRPISTGIPELYSAELHVDSSPAHPAANQSWISSWISTLFLWISLVFFPLGFLLSILALCGLLFRTSGPRTPSGTTHDADQCPVIGETSEILPASSYCTKIQEEG